MLQNILTPAGRSHQSPRQQLLKVHPDMSSSPRFFGNCIAAMVSTSMLLVGLTGCGGTKVLKNPEPMELVNPLVIAADERLVVTLDWVIVRGGPGTWAKNADWDEYLLRVRNNQPEPVSITSIAVYDSTQTRQSTIANRPALVKESKKTQKRYQGQGVKVKAGMGSGAIVAAAGASAYVGMSVGAAAIYAPGAAVAAAAGALILAPALAVGGVVRGVNNSKVNTLDRNPADRPSPATRAGTGAGIRSVLSPGTFTAEDRSELFRFERRAPAGGGYVRGPQGTASGSGRSVTVPVFPSTMMR